MTEININNFSEAMNDKADIDLGNVDSKADDDKVIHKSELMAEVLKIVYPVGSIYTSINNVNPSTFIGGTWESVGGGKVLWGVDGTHSAGSTIEASLPNITGSFKTMNKTSGGISYSGAFYQSGTGDSQQDSSNAGAIYSFDASKSSPIYGKSSTVQPPAYVVYFWKRVS